MNEIEYVITFDSKEKRMKNPLESWSSICILGEES